MADEKLSVHTPILITDTKLPDDVLRQVERIGMDLIRETERAEKAEQERDEALKWHRNSVVDSNEYRGVLADLDDVRAALRIAIAERDSALARVRELEADAGELAAFRFIVKWLNMAPPRSFRTLEVGPMVCERDCSDALTNRMWDAPTPVALADQLDPEWRGNPTSATATAAPESYLPEP